MKKADSRLFSMLVYLYRELSQQEKAYLAGQEKHSEIPEHLRPQLRLKKPSKGDGSVGVEKLLLSLFETSIKSFNHSDALKNKFRDKTVSLHPSGMSLSSVRKKHIPWRQGQQCVHMLRGHLLVQHGSCQLPYLFFKHFQCLYAFLVQRCLLARITINCTAHVWHAPEPLEQIT